MANKFLGLLVLMPCIGCTTMALERHTTNQAKSITDLRYREVMENLAMIAADHSFLPSFSTFYAGTADVSDTAQITSMSAFNRIPVKPLGTITSLGTQSLDVPLTRTVKQTWTLDPVVLPEKLTAMRAACQWVLFGQGCVDPEGFSMLKRYTPPYLTIGRAGDPPGIYFAVADQLLSIPSWWVHTGRLKDVPLHACYQAHCNDVYVWVMPDGIAQLSEFSLVLQEIARTDFGTVYFPRPLTRSIKISETLAAENKDRQILPAFPLRDDKTAIVTRTYTVYVDQNGFLTPGANLPALARIGRKDNIGQDANLRSIINSAKSP